MSIKKYCIGTLCVDYLVTDLNAMLRTMAMPGQKLNPTNKRKQY